MVGEVFEVYEIDAHAAWVEKVWCTPDGEYVASMITCPAPPWSNRTRSSAR